MWVRRRLKENQSGSGAVLYLGFGAGSFRPHDVESRDDLVGCTGHRRAHTTVAHYMVTHCTSWIEHCTVNAPDAVRHNSASDSCEREGRFVRAGATTASPRRVAGHSTRTGTHRQSKHVRHAHRLGNMHFRGWHRLRRAYTVRIQRHAGCAAAAARARAHDNLCRATVPG